MRRWSGRGERRHDLRGRRHPRGPRLRDPRPLRRRRAGQYAARTCRRRSARRRSRRRATRRGRREASSPRASSRESRAAEGEPIELAVDGGAAPLLRDRDRRRDLAGNVSQSHVRGQTPVMSLADAGASDVSDQLSVRSSSVALALRVCLEPAQRRRAAVERLDGGDPRLLRLRSTRSSPPRPGGRAPPVRRSCRSGAPSPARARAPRSGGTSGSACAATERRREARRASPAASPPCRAAPRTPRAPPPARARIAARSARRAATSPRRSRG